MLSDTERTAPPLNSPTHTGSTGEKGRIVRFNEATAGGGLLGSGVGEDGRGGVGVGISTDLIGHVTN